MYLGLIGKLGFNFKPVAQNSRCDYPKAPTLKSPVFLFINFYGSLGIRQFPAVK